MKTGLRLAGFVGILIFGGLLLTTFIVSNSIERAGQAFIKLQIEKEFKNKFGSGKIAKFKDKAKTFLKKYEREANVIKRQLKDNLPGKIAAAIASMCRLDCKQRKNLEEAIGSAKSERLEKLKIAKDKLTGLIKGKYLEILKKLKKDVRIFLGCNAFMFLLVTMTSFFKPQAFRHLFVPAIILFVATLISSYFYLFNQNWFFTIIYSDYTGWGYAVYLGLVFGILLDILFNKARITTEIINGILNAIGSAFSVIPC